MKTHISVAVRGSLAAAIAVLAQVATPAIGHALPTIASLTVSPSHGQARSTFTLTYQQTPCVLSQLPQGTEIRFSWNGAPPAGQLLGSALTNSTCKATLVTASPANAGVGSHEVDGYLPIPQDGSPATGTQATASYAVDVAPTAKPTASPTARATATPGANGTPAASANPSAGATPVPSGSVGAGSGGSGSNNAGSSNGNSASTGSGTSGSQSTGFGPPPYLGTPLGLLSVPLTFGFILLLLLLVIALLLWAMAERRRSEKAAAAASRQKVA